MKVLFFNGINITPHTETEMEIATDLMKEGHDLYFVQCRGELRTCCINFTRAEHICRDCRSRQQNSFDIIGLPSEKVLHFGNVPVDEKLIPEQFASIDELKAFTFEGSDIGMGVASSLVSAYRDHRLDTEKFKKEIRDGVWTSLYVHENAKKMLDELKPDLVIFFNGRYLEIRPMMRLCEERGIHFQTHERGGTLHTYILCDNSTPHSLSALAREIDEGWIKAPEEGRQERGKQFFTDRRNRILQSWIVFTGDQQRGSLPAGFDKSRKNIVIYNSSLDEYEGIAGIGGKIYVHDNAGIASLLESFEHRKDIHFYLRVHPNLKGLENTQVRELREIGKRFPNLTLVAAEEMIDTYALMDAADIVVVFGSTMGAEAAFWGKPVVLLGNSFYDHLKGFYKPATHEEAVALLEQDLQPLPWGDDLLKYGYWELERGIYYKYYKGTALFEGTFLGKSIAVTPGQKVLNYLLTKYTKKLAKAKRFLKKLKKKTS